MISSSCFCCCSIPNVRFWMSCFSNTLSLLSLPDHLFYVCLNPGFCGGGGGEPEYVQCVSSSVSLFPSLWLCCFPPDVGAYLVAMRQQTGCSVDPGQFPLLIATKRSRGRLIVQCLLDAIRGRRGERRDAGCEVRVGERAERTLKGESERSEKGRGRST